MADDILNSLLNGELNHEKVIDALSSSSSIVVCKFSFFVDVRFSKKLLVLAIVI